MERLFNNMPAATNNSINVNSHPLQCYNNQTASSNYTLFNSNITHIPSPTRHSFYGAHHHSHPTQPQPQPQTQTHRPPPSQRYTATPYSPYPSTMSYSALSIPSTNTDYPTEYYLPNRQIPINMNVSYKTPPLHSLNMMNHNRYSHTSHTAHTSHTRTPHTHTHPPPHHHNYHHHHHHPHPHHHHHPTRPLIHSTSHRSHTMKEEKQQQQQQQINVHYHFHDPSAVAGSIPSLQTIPTIALTADHHHHTHTHTHHHHKLNRNNTHHSHIITPYLPSATPGTVARSSSIVSNHGNSDRSGTGTTEDTTTTTTTYHEEAGGASSGGLFGPVSTHNVLSKLMNENSLKLSHQEIVFFEQLNHKLKRERQRERERKCISFPSGDRDKDKYIGLKRIGAGTFADIWEVYDQTDPERKHWAIKVLKKSKCLKKGSGSGGHTCSGKEASIDYEKYIKYSNAMIAEGNRILRVNKQDKTDMAQIIECKEILKCISDSNSIHQHSYDNNIGPCVVLELMGISLLQYTQLYEKNRICIPLVSVRCIAIQLFNALSFLHGIGEYIHADLKPENVLITLQHSINGNLMNNKYPNIKIVDLGNALSYNRNINTFEVQSLYYRAPEVLFGNEMTSRIDLWSIGCILFELININKFNKDLYFKSRTKEETKSRRHHHALFACCNRRELAQKIHDILSPYPQYVYNKYDSFYLNEMNKSYTNNSNPHANGNGNGTYLVIKELRKNQLIKRLIGPRSSSSFDLVEADSEYREFIDLISCLLDLNPATRYSSEDAIQHPFCINLKYIKNDVVILTLLSTQFHSTYPQISISTDFDRQLCINQQMEQFHMYQGMESERSNNHNCSNAAIMSVPIPKEMATTRKSNAFTVKRLTQPHNKVICLLNGCCSNNPTIKKKESLYAILPPLKKMKYNDF